MIYAVSKLFTAFFLPPGLFITLLILCAFLIKKRRWLPAGAALLLYLLSIHPVADRLLAPFEAPYKTLSLPAHADAVVTLGGGNLEGAPIPLMDEAFKRHIYGLSIAKKMDIPVIVSGSGKHGYSEFLSLLESMKRLAPLLCDEITVSESFTDHFAVIGETKSGDTYENARFTAKIIGKEDPAVIVVTSAYHMKRALALFRLAGIKRLYPAAVNFYIEPSNQTIAAKNFLPSVWALLNSYRAMHEFFGMIKVKARETLQG